MGDGCCRLVLCVGGETGAGVAGVVVAEGVAEVAETLMVTLAGTVVEMEMGLAVVHRPYAAYGTSTTLWNPVMN
ncbi:unnamed protein product [Lactuca virosa]|uniref:Uncharacterized protein n=1 Tax=Lactuca virosa TaxID=75947 RepID=A0AAU9PSV2_9ASTR|nr:unnamed protein product [Lactuca virosa]